MHLLVRKRWRYLTQATNHWHTMELTCVVAALSLGMTKARGLFCQRSKQKWVWGWSLQHTVGRVQQEDPHGGNNSVCTLWLLGYKGKRRNRNGQMRKRRETSTGIASVLARPAGFASLSWSLLHAPDPLPLPDCEAQKRIREHALHLGEYQVSSTEPPPSKKKRLMV